MEYDKLTMELYKENISWVYSIIKELDNKGIENKEKFITDPYVFNNIISLGYYFMNLYVVSNINSYTQSNLNYIMNCIIVGASSYNQMELSKIYKKDVDIKKLIDQYNEIVRKTKMYAPNDGLKARIVAVDEVYRKIYDVFNKRHFNIFLKIYMKSFTEYETKIKNILNTYKKD